MCSSCVGWKSEFLSNNSTSWHSTFVLNMSTRVHQAQYLICCMHVWVIWSCMISTAVLLCHQRVLAQTRCRTLNTTGLGATTLFWLMIMLKCVQQAPNADIAWVLSWQAAQVAYILACKSVCLLQQCLWLNVDPACLKIAHESLCHVWTSAVGCLRSLWTVCQCLLPPKRFPRLEQGYSCSDDFTPYMLGWSDPSIEDDAWAN